MERTLNIIKPDAVERNLIGKILARFEEKGLSIVAIKKIHLNKAEAEAFYQVHRGKPFFQSLTTYMTSGPVVVSVLEGDNAIAKVRDIMGATNPTEAATNTIRADFGENVERNSVHGSDAHDTAAFEIQFFFNILELDT